MVVVVVVVLVVGFGFGVGIFGDGWDGSYDCDDTSCCDGKIRKGKISEGRPYDCTYSQ